MKMNMYFIKMAFFSVLCCAGTFANAEMITSDPQPKMVSASKHQETKGEDFIFTFNIDDRADDTDSFLKVFVMGDLDANVVDENVTVFIDDQYYGLTEHVSGGTNYSNDKGYTVNPIKSYYLGKDSHGNGLYAKEFWIDMSLGSIKTNEFLADGQITFKIDFGPGVNLLTDIDPHTSLKGYAKVEYTYYSGGGDPKTGVPEPSTIAMFLLGLAGLASRKLKLTV
ncbi:PEP-CTERM sorting domain-containing protein [Thalassotalea maritima]|uniref:PEP-CTERM sorting domain-containing protein n=1 Tax=Thalassotalea maritima TaxID=3242416 RepID=UPI0035279BED